MKLIHYSYLVCLGFLFLIVGCGKSVSGSYVMHSKESAALLQLTETPDKRLIGTIQSISLLENGSIRQNTSNLSGAVDDDILTITIESGSFGSDKRNLSGKISNDTIDLVVIQNNQLPMHALFTKAETKQFEKASKLISETSKSILNEKRLQQQKVEAERLRHERIAQVDTTAILLTKDINAISAKQVKLTEQAEIVKKRYANALEYARKLLQKERQLVDLNTSATRTNAKSVKRELDSLIANVGDLDKNIKGSRAKWDQTYNDLDQRIAAAGQFCPASSSEVSGDIHAHPERCQLLKEAIAKYRIVQPQLKSTFQVFVDSMNQTSVELASLKEESASLLK